MSPGSMGKDSEWEFREKAWKRRGERSAPRTGAVLGLLLAPGIGRACGGKQFRLSQATSPSPDFLRGLCLPLGPFCHRPPAHQGPGRCCRRVSGRLRRLRHLGPPSLGSLPQAFAAPATWKPQRLSASSRGRYVIGRRRAAAGSLGPSLSCLSSAWWGEARVASIRLFGATCPATHPPRLIPSRIPRAPLAPAHQRRVSPAPTHRARAGGRLPAQHLGSKPAPPLGKPPLSVLLNKGVSPLPPKKTLLL